MDLLVQAVSNEIEELDANNVKLGMIGDLSKLPKRCEKSISEAIKKTQNNSKINLILALNYSARWEILEAAKKMALNVKNKETQIEEIKSSDFESLLTTKGIPDPELLIRTSGEKRISNFLLWQSAYTEFYFTDTLWPDFGRENFLDAIVAYQSRERRFGLVSEQIIKE